jgi:hypothetical protein
VVERMKDGWMDGWMDGRMNGWIWMERKIDVDE